MDLYEVLEKRRTYRDFTDEKVSDGILNRVISAAFKAPTNDHLRQLEFVVVRGKEEIAKVIAPLAKNMAAFKELVAEVDESGDKDKMEMFEKALPRQQKMLMESGLLILPFYRQLTVPLLKPAEQSSLNAKLAQLLCLCLVRLGEYAACRHCRRTGSRVSHPRCR